MKKIILIALLLAFSVFAITDVKIAKDSRFSYSEIPLDDFSTARDVNNKGEVVGFTIQPNFQVRGFYWKDNEVRILEALGDSKSIASAIEEEYIGGEAETEIEDNFLPVLWNKELLILESLGDNSGVKGFGRNKYSDWMAVGWSSLEGKRHAVTWDRNGKITDLGTFGYDEAMLYDGSEKGHLAGWVTNRGLKLVQAIIISPENEITILDSPFSVVLSVNDNGKAVGFRLEPTYQAFYYDGEDLIYLEDLGYSKALAYDINNKGDIVGTAKDADGKDRAVIWDSKTLEIKKLGENLFMATAISNNGFITGETIEGRAFLLSPYCNNVEAIQK